jgi:tetratricopeptide (TPR) repeat protein
MTAILKAQDAPTPKTPTEVPQPQSQPPSPEEIQRQQDATATRLLREAQVAQERKQSGQAVAKYREFLSQFSKRPEVPAARYGLAMAMMSWPDRDWNACIAELRQVVASDAPEKAKAKYDLGVALRLTGEQLLKDNPAEANKRLGEAVEQYTAAAKELSAQPELAARANVEAAEILAKTGRPKEAADLAKTVLNDPKNPQRPIALLIVAEAQYAAKDYPAAFATLAEMAPFDQPVTGLKARSLVGNILEETGEKPEALLQYDAIAKGYLEQRRKGEESLRNRQLWGDKPIEQARLEAFVRTTPQYVAMSGYRAGMIQYGYGQYADALPRFQGFLQSMPKSELAPVVQLHVGICQVQLKQPEGIRTLQPLIEHPQVGDQATLWLGKLQRISGNTTAAVATLGKGAEKAKDKSIRADMLLEQADTQIQLKFFKEAAATLEGIANDPSNAERAELAHEKWAQALHKGGDFAAGDAACARFLEKYPRSPLRPAVMFWQAENAYRQAIELAKTPEKAEQARQMQQQAATRYQAVVEKFPESAQASAARFGYGMALYRQGKWEKAANVLGGILDADKIGELVTASYYQADCLVRTMPENADDALSAARLAKSLEEATALLTTFVGTNEDRPEMPDALLKLADCHQRNSAVLADQQEKIKALMSARETYDRLVQRYPKHPAYATAVMERARCIAAVDPGAAINELNRFRADSRLSKSDIAPLALIRLSQLMVTNGRAVDAAVMLERARTEFEPTLAKDPAKASLVAGLRYQHGMALKESGRSKEAQALFEGVIKEFPDLAEASEATLALIQVQKDQALASLKEARRAIAKVPVEKPVDAALLAKQADAAKQMSQIAEAFAKQADRIAEKAEGSDLHVRTLRDAGTAWRAVAEVELDAAKRAKSQDSLKKLQEKLAKDVQVGKSNSVPRPPEIRVASLPVQAAEKKAQEYYNKALDAGPDSPVCAQLRLDLAEMSYERGDADTAIQLLTAALERNPAPDVQQRLRLRLGHSYLLKKDGAAAMQQALIALQDTNSPLRPAAYLVKGRAYMLQKNWGEAITTLQRYRGGAEKYVNAGAVTEEGLMRLGEAFAASANWDESRATYEYLINRFGNSSWVPQAYYGIGVALQQLKQFDRAVEAYAQVPRRTASEWAARAQLQIGLCRAEQKRWQDAVNELLIVPGSYDYDEPAAHSSLAAAKALVQLKKPEEAKEILQRVVRDHPQTQWAQEAAKQLKEIQ